MAAETTTAPGTPAARWHDLLAGLPTPAFVYDLDAITRTVGLLRRDAAVFGDPVLCFAVKANRCPDVLRHLAGLGVGADAGVARGARGGDEGRPGADLRHRACVRRRRAAGAERPRGGARPRQPVAVADLAYCTPRAAPNRTPDPPAAPFGAGPGHGAKPRGAGSASTSSIRLSRRSSCAGRLEVVQLHVHAGELAAAEEMERVGEVLVEGARAFGHVETVNLGGGFEYLRSDYTASLESWGRLAPKLAGLRVVLEPGRLVMAGAGHLVVTARAVERGSEARVVTVDASAWNLMPWFRPRVVAVVPEREGTPSPHSIAGCTCYEQDYFAHDQLLPRVAVGDRLVLDAAGGVHGEPRPGTRTGCRRRASGSSRTAGSGRRSPQGDEMSVPSEAEALLELADSLAGAVPRVGDALVRWRADLHGLLERDAVETLAAERRLEALTAELRETWLRAAYSVFEPAMEVAAARAEARAPWWRDDLLQLRAGAPADLDRGAARGLPACPARLERSASRVREWDGRPRHPASGLSAAHAAAAGRSDAPGGALGRLLRDAHRPRGAARPRVRLVPPSGRRPSSPRRHAGAPTTC